MYFLVDGRVNFLTGAQSMTFKSYLSGSYFGELEIFHSCNGRLFSVQCAVNSHFLTLDRDALGDLLDKFPHVEREMFEMVKKREAKIHAALEEISSLIEIP